MSIDAFVNGLRLAILADRVDTNRRVGTARDHAATIGGVRQNSRPGGICMDSIGVSESGAVHSQQCSGYLRAGRPLGRSASEVIVRDEVESKWPAQLNTAHGSPARGSIRQS